MLNIFNLKPEVFGLDIDDGSLRIAKLVKTKRGVTLVSLSELEMEKGIVEDGVIRKSQELSQLITKAVKKASGKKLGSYVASSLPEEKSFSQIIQMPKMSEDELKFSVPFEAENYIPFSLDKVYLDFQGLASQNENSNTMDVVINVMPRQVVDSYVNCLKKSSLVPYVLEVESSAIARAVMGTSKEPSLIIELKESKTNLIVYFNKSVRFTSTMQVASGQFTEAISTQFGFSMGQAEKIKVRYGLLGDPQKKYNIMKAVTPILDDFVVNIKKYLDFYQGHLVSQTAEKKFKKVILCGGGANLKGFSDFLSKKLGIPVVMGNPLATIRKDEAIKLTDENAMLYTTAIGLALGDIYNHD